MSMKFRINISLIVFFQILTVSVIAQFPPAAGQPGTTAMYKDSSIFVGWAITCDVFRGAMDISKPDIGNAWFGDATYAIGKAEGNSVDVVSLGDSGEALLSFETPISDGEGWDFAVFENALNDSFLELAFVEVSSDGVNYYRFSSASLTDTSIQVATFGALDASKINNLAGKYRQGFGTPFDLAELEGSSGLDLNHVTHIKIIDVVGCIQNSFANYDADGHKINDPWPTPFETGGFDLDGVGVIHTSQAGIDEIVNSFKVFPNPFTNTFKVTFQNSSNAQFEFVVANLIGDIIYKNTYKSLCMVDMTGFPAGFYFIKLKNTNHSIVHKILKIN